MKRSWNVLITAYGDGTWGVTCSPTAFGGGSLMGRAFQDETELKGFLPALRGREDEITRALEVLSGAEPGRKTYTVRGVDLSDEEIARHKLRPVR